MQITVTLANPELQQELIAFIRSAKEDGDLVTPEMFALQTVECALADRRLDRVNAQLAEARAKQQQHFEETCVDSECKWHGTKGEC